MATYGNIQRGPSDEQETGEDGDKEGGIDVNLVSFPWVADRILAHIKQAATEGRERLGKILCTVSKAGLKDSRR